MTKGEYSYPPDEFDALDLSARPRGSHRRPRSRWRSAWPFVIALVLSAALALAVVALVWDERDPVVTSQTTGVTAGSGTTTALPEPDLATPVRVFNATSVPGLATATAQRLREAGWSEVDSDDYAGEALPASTVRYGAAELEGSARAVADELGIDVVELAETEVTGRIEVVLEADLAE